MPIGVDIKGVQFEGKLREKLKRLTGIKPTIKIGILENATYENGQSVAEVAYINIEGLGGNPKRDFLRRAMEQHGDQWIDVLVKEMGVDIFSKENVIRAAKVTGMVAAGDIQEVIQKWPAADPRLNDPKTIRKKERRGQSSKKVSANNPLSALQDTNTMTQAIGFEVEV